MPEALTAGWRELTIAAGRAGALMGAGLTVVVLAGLAAVLLLLIVRDWERKKRLWAAFHAGAVASGLSDEERHLAARVARLARLKDPSLVFTDEAAFNRGLSALASSAAREDGAEGAVCPTCIFLTSLREKLGFPLAPGQARPTGISLGPIPEGSALAILRQRRPENLQALVVGHRNNYSEVLVALDRPVEAQMGESWVVRYPQGGVLWEFDAWVTGRSDGEVALRPTGRLRWINRRRFLRVATRRPAYVAPFPFLMNYQETSPPRFYEGTLTEIGGAGLRVDAPVRVAPGERVLVVVELAPDKVAEGTGIVRRAAPAAGGMTSLAVELVGLDTAEVAELTRQTQPVEPPVPGEPYAGRVVAERT